MKKIVLFTVIFSQILFAQEKDDLIEVTIKATPVDAVIFIDGKAFKNDIKIQLTNGDHNLKVQKAGYSTYDRKITISQNSTYFDIVLTKNDPVGVSISSIPPNAEIIVNEVSKGRTNKTLYFYPSTYELRLLLSGYLPFYKEITVGPDEKLNKFSFRLIKNTGKIKIDVNPRNSKFFINKEQFNANDVHELAPGKYEILIEADSYDPYKGIVEVVLGTTKTEKITLIQKTGILKFSINPPTAECVLSQKGVEKYKWTGTKTIGNIPEGIYDLTAKAKRYKNYSGKITIMANQTNLEEILMTSGSDTPDWMVFVESGTFTMGDNEAQGSHQVNISSFMIGKYEVTREMWESVMGGATGHREKRRPVETGNWQEVINFCNKLSESEGLQKAYSVKGKNIICDFSANGYRLPTEAEWEYAARGGNKSMGYTYSGSNNIDEVAWYIGNLKNGTRDVGTKKPNELGIYDMSGNLWEMCWDWSGDYDSSIQTDPTGPKSGTCRVIRGGSFFDHTISCTITTRSASCPDRMFAIAIGFRLVRSW